MHTGRVWHLNSRRELTRSQHGVFDKGPLIKYNYGTAGERESLSQVEVAQSASYSLGGFPLFFLSPRRSRRSFLARRVRCLRTSSGTV